MADEKLRWHFLGTGTLVPEPGRVPCASLVEAGGTRVLLDAGPGSLTRAARMGLDLFDVAAVLLTHYHQDHSAGLAPLLAALRFTPGRRRTEPLGIAGPPPVVKFLDRLLALYPELRPESFEIRPLEVPELPGEGSGGLELGPLRVLAVPVEHAGGRARGYRIRWEGLFVATAGDTGPCPALEDLARSARLFACECSFPTSGKRGGHMDPSALADLAVRARPGTLLVQHVYPPASPEGMAREIGRAWGGEVLGLADGTTLELDASGRLEVIGHGPA